MRKFLLALVVPLALTACGTTYQVPDAGEDNTLQARQMFAEARAMPARAPRCALGTNFSSAKFRSSSNTRCSGDR